MERHEMASSASAVRASTADAVTGELPGRVTADGQCTLQRPTHSQPMIVRSVEYQPRFVDIEPMQAIVAIGEMRLVLVPQQSVTMRVEGRRVSTEELASDARRRIAPRTRLHSSTMLTDAGLSSSGHASLRGCDYCFRNEYTSTTSRSSSSLVTPAT